LAPVFWLSVEDASKVERTLVDRTGVGIVINPASGGLHRMGPFFEQVMFVK